VSAATVLPNVATPPVASPASGMVAPPAKADGTNFGDVLLAVTQPQAGSTPGGSATAKRNHKGVTDTADQDAGPSTGQGAKAGDPAVAPNQPLPDIAALAQAASMPSGFTPTSLRVTSSDTAQVGVVTPAVVQSDLIASTPASRAAASDASPPTAASEVVSPTITPNTVAPPPGATGTLVKSGAKPSSGARPAPAGVSQSASGELSGSPVGTDQAFTSLESLEAPPGPAPGATTSSATQPARNATPASHVQPTSPGPTAGIGQTTSENSLTASVKKGRGRDFETDSPVPSDMNSSPSGSKPAAVDDAKAAQNGAVPIAAPDTVDGLLSALGSPAQQVAGALTGLAAETRAELTTSRTSNDAAVTANTTAVGGVKTLTIQLNPDHLGPVSITMRLADDAMDIRIAVSTPQALHQLEQDKHVLSAAVAALGGAAESLHVGSNAQGGTSGHPSQAMPDRTNGLPSDTASTNRQASGQGRPRGTVAKRNDQDDPTIPSTSRTLDGSLYV
jgi:flagellar hook-length control protein FliK